MGGPRGGASSLCLVPPWMVVLPPAPSPSRWISPPAPNSFWAQEPCHLPHAASPRPQSSMGSAVNPQTGSKATWSPQ